MRYFMLCLMVVALCTGQTCTPSTDSPTNSDGTTDSDETTDGGGTTDDGDSTDDGGSSDTTASAIIADHNASTAFSSIPASAITTAQSTHQIWYGHTSHGSQIVTGMNMLASEDSSYAYNTGSGALNLQENDSVDLGHNGDTTWVTTTRGILDTPGNNINMVVWSWCGGVSDNTEAGITTYLTSMNQLEDEYPSVYFVYMTGHLDGTGPGENLDVRNEQIRSYCNSNNKILFDFADIESYDPAGTEYPTGSDACEWCTTWCETNDCPICTECRHSHCFNCYQKGKAFWWMLARTAGWSGS